VLCALTVRKLRPGTYEQFRSAWEPEVFPEGFTRAYHLRGLEDENEVVSFGFFDGTMEELRQVMEREDVMRADEQRQREMAEVVEWTGTDAVFEVVEEVTPPQR
jgi:hypothetical protein